MQSEITVIKRDKTYQPLDPDKFQRIALATGLDSKMAEDVAKKTKQRVIEKAGTSHNTIQSIEIRDIFIEELQKASQHAAGLYRWFEKVKNQKSTNS